MSCVLENKEDIERRIIYVSIQPTEHKSNVPVVFLLQKLATFLEIRHSLDVRPADLHFEITGGEQIRMCSS